MWLKVQGQILVVLQNQEVHFPYRHRHHLQDLERLGLKEPDWDR